MLASPLGRENLGGISIPSGALGSGKEVPPEHKFLLACVEALGHSYILTTTQCSVSPQAALGVIPP